jgi:hypothetical protein
VLALLTLPCLLIRATRQSSLNIVGAGIITGPFCIYSGIIDITNIGGKIYELAFSTIIGGVSRRGR